MKFVAFLSILLPTSIWAQALSQQDKDKCRIYATQTAQRNASALSAKLNPETEKKTAALRQQFNLLKTGLNADETQWLRDELNKNIQMLRTEELKQVNIRYNQVFSQSQRDCLIKPQKFLIESTEINIYEKYPIYHYFEGQGFTKIPKKTAQ